MKCSKCKSILLEDKRAVFGDKTYFNGTVIPRCFVCSNCDCETFGIFWDEHGNIFDDTSRPISSFIDENPMAFGSEARKLHKQRLHPDLTKPLLKIWPFQWKRVLKHEANEDGKIDKIHVDINTLKWDKKLKAYKKWQNPIKVFCESIKDFKDTRKRFEEGEDYLQVRLRDSFNPPSFDKRWGRRLAGQWLRLFYWKYHKKIKKRKDK